MQKLAVIEIACSPPVLQIMISQKHITTLYFRVKNTLKVYWALGQK